MANQEQQAVNEVKGQVEEIKNSVVVVKNVNELWTLLDGRLKGIENRLTEIENKFKDKIKEGNGRGPISTRDMTEEDAARIMLGDMKTKSNKECAAELGLSYGQVYSARNGYTFKGIYADMIKLQKENKK